MTDARRTLAFLARQLYRDVHFVTQLNPVNIVDDETAHSFNSILGEARRLFPGNNILATFKDMAPRNIKYKDAVIVAGQLAAFLELVTAGIPVPAGAAPGANATPPPGENDSLDLEHQLYGKQPVKRNPDGTIPFSLE